jgi:hypothetical protein
MLRGLYAALSRFSFFSASSPRAAAETVSQTRLLHQIYGELREVKAQNLRLETGQEETKRELQATRGELCEVKTRQ